MPPTHSTNFGGDNKNLFYFILMLCLDVRWLILNHPWVMYNIAYHDTMPEALLFRQPDNEVDSDFAAAFFEDPCYSHLIFHFEIWSPPDLTWHRWDYFPRFEFVLFVFPLYLEVCWLDQFQCRIPNPVFSTWFFRTASLTNYLTPCRPSPIS